MGKQHSKHPDYSSAVTHQNCINDRLGKYCDIPSSSKIALQDSQVSKINSNIPASNKLTLKQKEAKHDETDSLSYARTMSERAKEDSFLGIEERNVTLRTVKVNNPTTGGRSSRLSGSPDGTAKGLAFPPSSNFSSNVASRGSMTVCCREQDLMNSAEDVMRILQNLCVQRTKHASNAQPAERASEVSKVLTLHVILAAEPTSVDVVSSEPLFSLTNVGSDEVVADLTSSEEIGQHQPILTTAATSAGKPVASSKELGRSSKDSRHFRGWSRCFACFNGCGRRKKRKTTVWKNASSNSVNPSTTETADEEYTALDDSWRSEFDEKQLAMLIQKSMDLNEHINRCKPRSNQANCQRENDLSAEWTDDNNDVYVRSDDEKKILRPRRRTYENGSLSNCLHSWNAPPHNPRNLQSCFAEQQSPLNIVNLPQTDSYESCKNFAQSKHLQCINNLNLDKAQIKLSNSIEVVSNTANRMSHMDEQCVENSNSRLSSIRRHANLTGTKGVGRLGKNDSETVSTAHYLRRHRHRERNQCRAMRQVARWIHDSERQSFEPVDDVLNACAAGGDSRVVHNHMHEHYHHHYHHHHYCDPNAPLHNS